MKEYYAMICVMNWSDCTLCPRMCHADRTRGPAGFCGQGRALSVSRISLHDYEEPCISGTNGSGAVFFTGCSLGCVTCQNAAISGRGARGRTLTPAVLADAFLRLEERGAHNINLVTPTHFWPDVARAVEAARNSGLSIPVLCNTSGYERTETLRDLSGLIDVYLPDCKYYSSDLSERLSRAPDYFERTISAIEEMVRQTGVPVFHTPDGEELDAAAYNDLMAAGSEDDDYQGPLIARGTIVRHMMLPGQLDDSRHIVSEVLARFGNQVYLSLMCQYTPMPAVSAEPGLACPVTQTDYDALLSYAIDQGLENGFFQGAGTADESFIPPFDDPADPQNLLNTL